MISLLSMPCRYMLVLVDVATYIGVSPIKVGSAR
jgi:hypothetical protein